MFLRQLSSSGSSFLSHSRPALCRAGLSSSCRPRFPPPPPPPPPWCSWSRPLHQTPPAWMLLPQSLHGGSFGSRWRYFSSSAGLLMEHHNQDRGPPHKRRKSTEEKRSAEDKDGHRREGAGTGGGAKDAASRKENSKHHLKDGGQGSVVSAGKAGSKDNVGRSKETYRERSSHHRDSQTNTPRSHMSRLEQEKAPGHQANPWFRGRGPEQRAGWGRTGPGRPGEDRGSDGRQWPGRQAHSVPAGPWSRVGINREPPPPGTCPPAPQQGAKTALQRRWEAVGCSGGPQPAGGRSAFDFSIMSYNILSQALLQDNQYLYQHCAPAVLSWSHRLPNLLAEIQQHGADILCLQEVQEDHYQSQIRPALQALGYHCEYKKRTGSKPDGCAVVFNSARLQLVSSNPVEFLRRGDALLDRDNVGLVLLLRPRDPAGGASSSSSSSSSSPLICVANTHLLYNPRRGDIKLAQLAILLAELGRLSRLPDGSSAPVILCGDLNSTPWSPLYRFLTTGALDYGGMQIGTVSGQESSPRGQRLLSPPLWSRSLGIDQRCQYREQEEPPCSPSAVEGAISNLTVQDLAAVNRARIEHGLKLLSSYQHRLLPDGRPEITTCHSRTAMTVDYILYSPELDAATSPGGRGLQLLGRLSLVGEPELEEVAGLPNQSHSSDHLPLLARFRLRR